MTTETELPARAERDGCGCPPWVMRCAHFEGKWLIVHYFDDCWAACNGPDPMLIQNQFDHGISACGKEFNTETEALNAFYAAELELLRGTEP